MNNPLDLDAIRGRLHHAYGLGLDESMARRYRADVPALVAEVERLHTLNAELVALVRPILDRTEGQIGTHSDRCFEYHVACLAGLVRVRLDAGSQTEGAEGGT